MKAKVVIAVVVGLMLAPPVLAGDKHKHKKCDQPVQDCLNGMVEKLKTTGFIGVELDDGKKGKKGEALIVTKVIPGSPAEKAGIAVGDELYALNGIKFDKKNHEAMAKVKKPGKTVTCTIKRNGANRKFKLTLAPMPADLLAKYIGEHMMDHAKVDTKLAKK
ncbi:MAG: PDZ domain-containing protein [Myxococcota bacterium]|nr:PDZ domain-containing protein [Myxococcota bacterium]